VVLLALQSAAVAKEYFPDYRLTKLVCARLQLDETEIALLSAVIGINLHSNPAAPRPFDDQLRHVISRYRLQQLFSDDGHAPYHHGIRPTGYDFFHDEVIPEGMEKWRASYRGMSEERQMLAASVIWLYRAGKDNVWLRRVPCTWHAGDAIERMRSTVALSDWVRLFALYPGW